MVNYKDYINPIKNISAFIIVLIILILHIVLIASIYGDDTPYCELSNKTQAGCAIASLILMIIITICNLYASWGAADKLGLGYPRVPQRVVVTPGLKRVNGFKKMTNDEDDTFEPTNTNNNGNYTFYGGGEGNGINYPNL